MEREPTHLSEARDHLKQFERLLKDAQGRDHLNRGITLLIGLIEGDYPQRIKDTAVNLTVSYRNRVVSEVKRVLSDASSLSETELWDYHWVMQEFVEAGLDDDQLFNACHSELLACWFDRFWKSLSPREQEVLKSEFKRKTTPGGS